jgi:hypothetical protein
MYFPWLSQFILISVFLNTQRMGMLRIKGADLFYTSSISLPDEMERNGELLVPWMPWMIGLLWAHLCKMGSRPIATVDWTWRNVQCLFGYCVGEK